MNRESFGSRLGFILVSAGCAIGIGNVWRFPYVAGEYGGGVFVMLYLLFLLIMGIPVLTMELAVGRAGKNSPVKAFKALESWGSKWHLHGWTCLIGNTILMLYYTTVSGWMLSYFYKFVTGTFHAGMSADEIGGVFGALLANPMELGGWMAFNVIFGFAIVSLGIKNGVERITKIMMLALIFLIMVLAVNSVMLDGAVEGLKFYLLPDFDRALSQGLSPIITAAMAQAFFTLSIGIGAMEIFGSYITKEHTLMGEAVRICALDTFVAIMAGLIIFPACFSFGVHPDAGPSLIFVTLPNVFVNMSGGMIWGSLFFLFMTFASFSTVIAVFESIMAGIVDNFGLSRQATAVIAGLVVLVGSIPCVLGFNVWSDVTIVGNMGILDFEDFIVSNLLLPLGSMIFLLFCTTKWGWGYDDYIREVNTGDGPHMPSSPIIKCYLRYIVPILVLFILYNGLV